MDDTLSAELIARDLNTRVVGRRVEYLERVGSTNDVAAQFADAGDAEGLVVIADEQTQGRGRMKRAWLAPAHSSLLLSILFRPRARHAQIAMAVALGASKGITKEIKRAVQLKWPNDLLLNGKKCAGILTEAKTIGDKIEYVIAGVGVNVNFHAADLPDIPRAATTLSDELDAFIPRVQLAQSILRGIDDYYARFSGGTDLDSEWKARLATIGQRVRAQIESRIEEGIAENVDREGALLLRRADGTIAKLIAGDVTLIA
ncbi:MAG: biotin--[acetyl-CoA-carboxylase] ligase [Chloroflexi bacterium]|nr:biotin--[acetyl-CoA-carboxylase] ligase [Chloroflexota bacterium]MBI3740619.1 biotin--[acetyl-CoA-carboxylase] ligase [Chloroflexota bacterium]